MSEIENAWAAIHALQRAIVELRRTARDLAIAAGIGIGLGVGLLISQMAR